MGSASANPSTVPVTATYDVQSAGRVDRAVLVADRHDAHTGLGGEPGGSGAFPNPCTAAVAVAGTTRTRCSAASATWATPRDVAVDRPREPPMLTGLPVTSVSSDDPVGEVVGRAESMWGDADGLLLEERQQLEPAGFGSPVSRRP